MSDNLLRTVRQLVLESLYEADSSTHEPEAALLRQLRRVEDEEENGINEHGPRSYGVGMLRGVRTRQHELDRYIGEAAPRFPVDSMAVVDRNILRLAIWELVTDTSAPTAAVVNEAVELARRYGGEKSPAFVNGVLRTVAEKVRGAGAAPRSTVSDPPNPDSQENL